MRDVVDARDVVETFVPLARRLGWLARRITGMMTSTMGGLAMALIPGASSRVEVKKPIRVEEASKGKRSEEAVVGSSVSTLHQAGLMSGLWEDEPRLGSAIGLEIGTLSPESSCSGIRSQVGGEKIEASWLGLEGVEAGMAPDVDGEVLET